jgi:hypothetical protein
VHRTQGNPRRLILWPRFETEWAEIARAKPRAAEYLDGLEWLLTRDPFAGFQSEKHPNLWYFPLLQPEGPPLQVIYMFTSQLIWFLSVHLLDETNGHGG